MKLWFVSKRFHTDKDIYFKLSIAENKQLPLRCWQQASHHTCHVTCNPFARQCQTERILLILLCFFSIIFVSLVQLSCTTYYSIPYAHILCEFIWMHHFQHWFSDMNPRWWISDQIAKLAQSQSRKGFKKTRRKQSSSHHEFISSQFFLVAWW